MRQFFYQKELKLKKKRLLMMVACMAVLLAGYVILTWPKKVESEAPTVIVESAEKGDVEIYPQKKTCRFMASTWDVFALSSL